jgi:hypothetical protein
LDILGGSWGRRFGKMGSGLVEMSFFDISKLWRKKLGVLQFFSFPPFRDFFGFC